MEGVKEVINTCVSPVVVTRYTPRRPLHLPSPRNDQPRLCHRGFVSNGFANQTIAQIDIRKNPSAKLGSTASARNSTKKSPSHLDKQVANSLLSPNKPTTSESPSTAYKPSTTATEPSVQGQYHRHMRPNGVIGQEGRLPWDILKTGGISLGKPGRYPHFGRCYEEMIERTKEGRQAVVLSRDPDFLPEFGHKAPSIPDAWNFSKSFEREIWICGGEQIYYETLRLRQLLITKIHAEIEGDAHFPHGHTISPETHRQTAKMPVPISSTFMEMCLVLTLLQR